MKIEKFTPIQILLSEKADGNMRAQDARDNFIKNSGVNPTAVIAPVLHHDERVVVMGAKMLRDRIFNPDCDGLITNMPGIMLTVNYADCFPIIFMDQKNHAVGIAHCGWRGLRAGIISKMLATMFLEYGSETRDMDAYVGPGIMTGCYEVHQDVSRRFSDKFSDPVGPDSDSRYLDLRSIISSQLYEVGLKKGHWNIDCTKCELAPSGDFKYFSGRRDKEDPVKVNMAAVMLPQHADDK